MIITNSKQQHVNEWRFFNSILFLTAQNVKNTGPACFQHFVLLGLSLLFFTDNKGYNENFRSCFDILPFFELMNYVYAKLYTTLRNLPFADVLFYPNMSCCWNHLNISIRRNNVLLTWLCIFTPSNILLCIYNITAHPHSLIFYFLLNCSKIKHIMFRKIHDGASHEHWEFEAERKY